MPNQFGFTYHLRLLQLVLNLRQYDIPDPLIHCFVVLIRVLLAIWIRILCVLEHHFCVFCYLDFLDAVGGDQRGQGQDSVGQYL